QREAGEDLRGEGPRLHLCLQVPNQLRRWHTMPRPEEEPLSAYSTSTAPPRLLRRPRGQCRRVLRRDQEG
ncbi:hypothetical protein ACJX0J_007758, partial [Zea mays]